MTIGFSRLMPLRGFVVVTCLVICGRASGDDSSSTTVVADEAPQVVADVQVHPNQKYDASIGSFGRCDVYLPAASRRKKGHPVVVVVHGGGWLSGDKWTMEGYARQLASNGIAVVAINYRLAPQHKFPAQLDDVRKALLWTIDQSDKYSFDSQRLGLFGYSAGGHLSLLASSIADQPIDVQSAASAWPESDKRWSRLPQVTAVCVGGPPCDFQTMPLDNTTLAYFLGGSRRQRSLMYQVASPLHHVSTADPVTQIIHGDQDLIVPIAGSEKFHAKQIEAGVDSQLTRMKRQGHMVTFLNPKTGQLVVEFFQEQFQLSAGER